MTDQIAFEVKLETTYEESVRLVTEALKAEGFGVLTEIDVKATLKKKLDENFRPYVILGACNPPLAHKALLAAPEVGMLLPCNVTVEASDEGGSLVRILDPLFMMGVPDFVKNQALAEVAAQAHEKLARVAQSLE
ncbi:MAG TPA: ABC transporter ATP-binding protein [Chloroflexi bacterium]|nr:ABC transporter ATP-binding protein [Chloroflexota bacterium]